MSLTDTADDIYSVTAFQVFAGSRFLVLLRILQFLHRAVQMHEILGTRERQ